MAVLFNGADILGGGSGKDRTGGGDPGPMAPPPSMATVSMSIFRVMQWSFSRVKLARKGIVDHDQVGKTAAMY
jgi:hypothetical protein